MFEPTESLTRAQRAVEASHFDEARLAYSKALEYAPESVDALRGLGYSLFQLGNLVGALDAMERALNVDPTDLLSMLLMGRLCLRLQQPAGAEAHFRTILERIPASDAARSGLIDALVANGNLAEAKAQSESILKDNPGSEVGTLAAARLASFERDDELALVHFEKLVRRWPANPTHLYNRSLCLLRLGRFEQGWRDYEFRFAAGAVQVKLPASPRWEGQPVERLLLVAEQGLGDTILFSRFVPDAARRAGCVTLVCPGSLVNLLSRNLSVDCVPAEDVQWPPHDAHLPIMSLPHVLNLGASAIQARSPYLTPDPVRRALWGEALGAHDSESLRNGRSDRSGRIGLVNATSVAHSTEATPFTRRSCPASELRPLTELDRVLAFNLNLGRAAEDACRELPALRALGAPLADFEDTAAVVSLLDAVVTVDTALVHLAGAVGTRSALLLPPSPDWKWQQHASPPVWHRLVTQIRASSPAGWARPVQAAIELSRQWLAALHLVPIRS